MQKVTFDARAKRLLQRYGPGQAVLVAAVNSYGLPGEALTVERYSAALAERDPELVRLDATQAQGVPVYAHRRVAAYAHWRPLRVTAHGFGPCTTSVSSMRTRSGATCCAGSARIPANTPTHRTPRSRAFKRPVRLMEYKGE